jgi:RimJ/RimL family protein N-acetyltransferase
MIDMLNSQPQDEIGNWTSRGISQERIEKMLEDEVVFGIYLCDTHEFIGFVGIYFREKYRIPEFNNKFWIHYFIDYRNIGRGIASNALRETLDHHVPREIKQVYAGVYKDNKPSIRVLEKNGFTRICSRGRTDIFCKTITERLT